ncbi:heterokaryon incompatibility protein-domain-containing protein [Lasiosphaeria ovina]|uniref:Heterokaryon incompatibility protein-domain-containing protein n=1 Tax=Lasiosphaeria ovina TaxID=92902 RepID=A0AAE0N6S4_9PEZI|nr:heterokaryon incompatibility protein-domain-containing protein [Lasiosphaeria ovina]
MWLINTSNLKLEYVEHLGNFGYAVLSHTWRGDSEPSHQDFKFQSSTGDIAHERFAKIRKTCELASEQRIPYAWVDTCCIDKTSSAELTEAINSMFKWYQEAAVCYVYLSDLEEDDGRDIHDVLKLTKYKWFRRGWTLQELIASRHIQFYDRSWKRRGDKASLRQTLYAITKIDEEVLADSSLLPTIPVARRMSWAAKRQTTREEDLAYCLFGIFNVHLPLIYGEGTRAFIRLQEAIAQDNNDLSLFAWTAHDERFVGLKYRGLMAESPREFKRCSHIKSALGPAWQNDEYTITNKGIRLTATVIESEIDGMKDYLLGLQCYDGRNQLASGQHNPVFIRLVRTPTGYARHAAGLALVSPDGMASTKPLSLYVAKSISERESRTLESNLSQPFQLTLVKSLPDAYGAEFYHACPHHLWDKRSWSFMTDGSKHFTGVLRLCLWGALKQKSRMHFSNYCKCALKPKVGEEPAPPGSLVFYNDTHEWHWPHFFILLGLHDGGGSSHRPWLSVHDTSSEDGKTISTLLSHQQNRGIGVVMESIRAIYLPRRIMTWEETFTPRKEKRAHVQPGATKTDEKSSKDIMSEFGMHVRVQVMAEGDGQHPRYRLEVSVKSTGEWKVLE